MARIRRPPFWVGTAKCHVLGILRKWDLEFGAEYELAVPFLNVGSLDVC